MATIHLQRKWATRPEGNYEFQRLSYDLTHQTEDSLEEFFRVMDWMTKNSGGEFSCVITGDPKTNGDAYEFGDVIYGVDFRPKELLKIELLESCEK